MSHPQVPQKPFPGNGVGRRKIDKDGGSRSDNQNWRQHARIHSSSFLQGVEYCDAISTTSGPGDLSAYRGGDKPVHERLLYMHTCLIGQQVEVQKVNGHVYSGIFHAANVEKDFGVILKMARLVKDGTRGLQGESGREAGRKPPMRTYVIQGKDFVQIIAKDVSLSGDTISNGRSRENRADLVTDAVLSQGWHRELDRELKPWLPDDEPSESLHLNLNSSWSRNWDQFEANKALFGVETTFDEELYTTKLVRGPQMREREREAQRIAREIVGQQTRNIHLAEERGMRLAPEIETMDEESKYSSVLRGEQDVGEDDEDKHIDDHNIETFGGALVLATASSAEADVKGTCLSSAEAQIVNGALKGQTLQDRRSSSLEKGDVGSPDSLADTHREHLRLRKLLVGDKTKHCSKGPSSPYNSPVGRGSPLLSPLVGDPTGIKALNLDPSCPQLPDDVHREFKEFKQLKQLEALKALSESFKSEASSEQEDILQKELEPRSPRTAAKIISGELNREGSLQLTIHDSKSNLAPISSASQITSQASAPPPASLPLPTALGSLAKPPSTDVECMVLSAVTITGAGALPAACCTPQIPGSTLYSNNQGMVFPTISPSSSTASLASVSSSTKKSPLNPSGKEFKLNPNAKAFTPSFCSPRPASSVAQHPSVLQGPVYIHASLPAMSSLQGVPVNLQTMQQNQVGQFAQYTHTLAAAAVSVNSTPYMQSPGSSVPGFPVGGVSGGSVLPGQPNMRIAPQSQQQVIGPYGHPQHVKYPPPPPSMQPGFLHSNGQMYQQQMMYGQPGSPVVYIPYPQGHSAPSPPQGHHIPLQASPQTGGGLQGSHYGGAPPLFAGQQHNLQQPQISYPPSTPSGNSLTAVNSVTLPPQGTSGHPCPSSNGGNGTGRGRGSAFVVQQK